MCPSRGLVVQASADARTRRKFGLTYLLAVFLCIVCVCQSVASHEAFDYQLQMYALRHFQKSSCTLAAFLTFLVKKIGMYWVRTRNVALH